MFRFAIIILFVLFSTVNSIDSSFLWFLLPSSPVWVQQNIVLCQELCIDLVRVPLHPLAMLFLAERMTMIRTFF